MRETLTRRQASIVAKYTWRQSERIMVALDHVRDLEREEDKLVWQLKQVRSKLRYRYRVLRKAIATELPEGKAQEILDTDHDVLEGQYNAEKV